MPTLYTVEPLLTTTLDVRSHCYVPNSLFSTNLLRTRVPLNVHVLIPDIHNSLYFIQVNPHDVHNIQTHEVSIAMLVSPL